MAGKNLCGRYGRLWRIYHYSRKTSSVHGGDARLGLIDHAKVGLAAKWVGLNLRFHPAKLSSEEFAFFRVGDGGLNRRRGGHDDALSGGEGLVSTLGELGERFGGGGVGAGNVFGSNFKKGSERVQGSLGCHDLSGGSVLLVSKVWIGAGGEQVAHHGFGVLLGFETPAASEDEERGVFGIVECIGRRAACKGLGQNEWVDGFGCDVEWRLADAHLHLLIMGAEIGGAMVAETEGVYIFNKAEAFGLVESCAKGVGSNNGGEGPDLFDADGW